MFPVNRIVAFLTPAFTAGAAVASGWLLKHAPGVPAASVVELTAIEVTAASAATGAALKWLHGHQKYETDIRWADHAVKAAAQDAEKLDPGITTYVEQLVKGEVEKLEGNLARKAAHASACAAGSAPAATAPAQS